MKALVAVLGVMALAGCSSLQPITEKGAELNDEVVDAAEFALCYGASVGAIRRRYGEKGRAEVWQSLCGSVDDFTPETK